MSAAPLPSTSSLTALESSPRLATEARVENALERALERAGAGATPPRLARAMRHAVLSGGGRLRPQLCALVAQTYGDPHPEVTDACAAAIELIHCASLVHDDMPCFDDADTRRGQPSVHRAFGEAMALLVGDALIVLAFREIGRAAALAPDRAAALVTTLADATGAGGGIIGGQAWELETAAPLEEYHRAKTASLFTAAAALGAIASGADPAAWGRFGDAVGRAYQAADDVRDAAGTEAVIGKPVGRDAALGRPSVVAVRGVDGARARVRELVSLAASRVPAGDRADLVHGWLARVSAALDRL